MFCNLSMLATKQNAKGKEGKLIKKMGFLFVEILTPTTTTATYTHKKKELNNTTTEQFAKALNNAIKCHCRLMGKQSDTYRCRIKLNWILFKWSWESIFINDCYQSPITFPPSVSLSLRFFLFCAIFNLIIFIINNEIYSEIMKV